MFVAGAGILSRSCISIPPPLARPHRVLLRIPWGKEAAGTTFGPWSTERALLNQYTWRDGTPLLYTSTAQLPHLQAQQRHVPHLALNKWEAQLQCTVPGSIWKVTWLNYRRVNENTFMWQLLYRVIATQRWRFPARANTDATTWCTRCTEATQEDVLHCLWSCPLSTQCWQWGESILQAASGDAHNQITLLPEHIFLAQPLPAHWQCPERLWHLLKAIVSWQIWKNRNEHYMAAQPTNAHRVIRKSWARLGTYLRKEWWYLDKKVDLGRVTAAEGEDLMHKHFGSCPDIWSLHGTLHGITLQVPPVPPRPP